MGSTGAKPGPPRAVFDNERRPDSFGQSDLPDRLAREPAHLFLLGRDFAKHGTEIRALDDRGGCSPGGELTGGILGRLPGARADAGATAADYREALRT